MYLGESERNVLSVQLPLQLFLSALVPQEWLSMVGADEATREDLL